MGKEKILQDFYNLKDAVYNYKRLSLTESKEKNPAFQKVVELYGKVAYYYKRVSIKCIQPSKDLTTLLSAPNKIISQLFNIESFSRTLVIERI